MNKPIQQMLFQVDKWLIGLIMTVVAYPLKKYVLHSVKRADSTNPDAGDLFPLNFYAHLFFPLSINCFRTTSFISCLAAARARSLVFVSNNLQS